MKRREALYAVVRRCVVGAVALVAGPAIAQNVDKPAAGPAPTPRPPDNIVEELKTLLQTQAKQWSSGDVEGFCSHYSEDCIFLSPGGVTKGRKEVLARYKAKYVDKAAMGKLTLEVLSETHSDRLASIALQYTLSYTDRPAAKGSSLIGVEKVSGRWLIVHDASM